MEEIKAWPRKFPDWQIYDNRIYIHRKAYLLDPVIGEDNNWKLVLPLEWQKRALHNIHHEIFPAILESQKLMTD